MEKFEYLLGKKVKVTYDTGKAFVGHVVYGEQTFNEGKFMLRTTAMYGDPDGLLYLDGEGGIKPVSIELYGSYDD